jgi:hypothetical protein
MKKIIRVLPIASLLLFPVVTNAQKAGQIVCGRNEAYAYLYSSMITMDIAATLKCGQPVRVLDRSDNWVHVQTENGEDGFVPLNSVTFVKNPAALKTLPSSAPREITHYDKPEAPAKPTAARGELVIANQTPVHLKLTRALSSETAKVGEEVSFEVADDLVVNGYTVVKKGAAAAGSVTEAEPRGRMGKAGKLNVSVSSVQLANGGNLPLRSFGINTPSADQKSGVLPKFHGKETVFAEGSEMTAYVDGDQHLSAAKFPSATAPSAQSANAKP